MTGTNDKLRALVLAVLMVTSVFAGTIAFAGTAAAANDDTLEEGDDYDLFLETGGGADSRFWQGQTLYINDDSLANQTLELYALERDSDEPGGYIQGDFVAQVSIDATGEATVSTGSLEGDYALYDGTDSLAFDGTEGGSSNATNAGAARFSVTPQTLSAEFDDSTVDEEETDLLLESNRANYVIDISSDNASYDDLVDIFGEEADEFAGDDEDEYSLEVASNDAEIAADFADVDTGDYSFDIEVNDTGVTATADITNQAGDDLDANFAQSAYSQARGDVVEFTIEFTETSEGTVFVGSEDVNYLAEVDIEDDDDDDEVTVQWNTYDNSFSSEDDSVTLVETTDGEGNTISLSTPLDEGDYDMNVTANDDEKDVATVALTETTVSGFSISTAPEGVAFSDVDEPDEVAAAIDDGLITQTDTIAAGDTVVHALEGDGIFGAVEANGGDSVTTLVALNNSDAIQLRFVEENPGPNSEGTNVSLNNTDIQSGAELVSDEENGTLYVHVDSEALLDAGFEEDDEVNVTLDIYEESELVDDDVTLFTTFEVVEPDAEFNSNTENEDGDEIVEVAATDGQEVTGTTNVAPGTELTIRARATGDSPFLLSNDTEVDANGTFAATFDFTNVSSGQEFTLSISSPSKLNPNNVDTAEIDGVVVGANETGGAAASISDQSGDGSTVTVDSVTLPEGGFVTIHDSTLVSDGDAFGSVLGTSEYLENGTSRNVEVTLDSPVEETQTIIAMPHQDTNDNEQYDFVTSEGEEDAPYTDADGNIVTAQAEYTVATPTPTPTEAPETTAPPEETATPAEGTEMPTDTEAPATTADGGQPGFTAVLAVIALLAAALLAYRRD